jgi:hypothetical protein
MQRILANCGRRQLSRGLLILTVVGAAFGGPPAAAAQFTKLHEFKGGDDASFPSGALAIGTGGVLFGASFYGGGTGCSGSGCGTVYSLTPPGKSGEPWTEKVLHAFGGRDHGIWPNGVTLGADGAIYGTTITGGVGGCLNLPGCGTVFRLTPPTSPSGNWSEEVLYRFRGRADAAMPGSLLVASDATLYGSSSEGGSNGCGGGCGTIFRLLPPRHPANAWTERVLHAFSTSEGSPPNSLTLFRDSLYGSTQTGGPEAAAPSSAWRRRRAPTEIGQRARCLRSTATAAPRGSTRSSSGPVSFTARPRANCSC